MSPGQGKLPSDSIKVVPGRSKLRVESSNPVARGNPVPRPSKVKCIAPEEVIKLHSGVSKVPLPPASVSSRPYKPARRAFESQRPKPTRAAFESQRPPRHVPDRPIFKPPRPVPPRPTYEPPRPVPARPAPGLRKELCVVFELLRTRSRVKLPPSPRAFQIPSRVRQQDTTDATIHTIQRQLWKLVIKLKIMVPRRQVDQHLKKGSQSYFYTDQLCSLLGRDAWWIPPRFFLSLTASFGLIHHPTSAGTLRLSMAMPIFLEVELVPTGRILNNVLFGRNPKAIRCGIILFLDEKETVRSKGERAHLFETMASRKAMIKASVNGTELLIFSSTLLLTRPPVYVLSIFVHNLSLASRIINICFCVFAVFIKKQHKTENYLWGFFLHNKNSQAHVPGTSHHLDDGNVVDMDIDPEDQKTLGLTLQPIAVSQSTSSSLPPGLDDMDTNLLKALLIFRRKTVLES
ncbi:hypothetical protein HID58_007679 [Brassica napus]|uniref:AIPP2-like SPOC-like domain-containing protein n=1 Tax=Brassica napus TaxID=3708 RepID=A0ABQ8EFM7_BRANA|nr:hypothetical protein HID58_007679 [Brassica napus]